MREERYENNWQIWSVEDAECCIWKERLNDLCALDVTERKGGAVSGLWCGWSCLVSQHDIDDVAKEWPSSTAKDGDLAG